MIKNLEYLTQPVDFSNLPSYGQDIDYFLDFECEVFVGADLKYDSATLTQGQRITVCNLLKVVGVTAPIFFAVVQHSDEAPAPVDAGNGRVREVYYSWPSLGGVRRHVYDEYDDMSYREWIGTIAVVYFKHRKLNPTKVALGPWYNPTFMFDDVFAAAWDSVEGKASRRKYARWEQRQNIASTGQKDFPLIEVLADSAHLRHHWTRSPFLLL